MSFEADQQSDQPTSLSAAFTAAENLRSKLDSTPSSTHPEFLSLLTETISNYTRCAALADRLALFSTNENLDDIATSSLPHLLLHFRIAELTLRKPGGLEAGRKQDLLYARSELEKFLAQLDNYRLLSKSDEGIWERYTETKDNFEVLGQVDAQTRREGKIRRWKEEKELKARLEYLTQNTHIETLDENSIRKLYLAAISLAIHESFASLESIALEIHVLAQAPSPSSVNGQQIDSREKQKQQSGYSDRLDPSLSSLLRNGRGGPILDKSGRPLQPFTLLDKRSQLQQGVFRPDYNLPTMSIDEYLEEERRRGGIIEGGGEASGRRPEIDEDDIDKADAETMKARAWDEFKEENQRGSGNTLNRG